MFQLVACATLLALVGLTKAGNPDEVLSLPGLTKQPGFKHYSGYLKTTSSNRHLHYWFTESAGNPTTDPLILWLNGGPGCSSLGGLLTELGPFHVNQDGKTLYYNPWSWNLLANVIFLESPAGVGFSYTDDGDVASNDTQTAADSLAALRHFFLKFPQFKQNDFYIVGESYGGVYVPTLSVQVLRNAKDFNFKGWGVGNGLLHQNYLGDSAILFGYFHGLYGLTIWKELIDNCCNGAELKMDMRGLRNTTCRFVTNPDPKCQQAVSDANNAINNPEMDLYNIYADCYYPSADLKKTTSREWFDRKLLRKQLRAHSSRLNDNLPCVNTGFLDTYLNQDSVRQALHISPKAGTWSICSADVGGSYTNIYTDLTPQVLELVKAGKRGLIYNGDIDLVCNFLGDQWFSDALGLPLVNDYQEWHFGKQVAGFRKDFQNLTFATVKGSGHLVPQDKPGPAFTLISNFLANK